MHDDTQEQPRMRYRCHMRTRNGMNAAGLSSSPAPCGAFLCRRPGVSIEELPATFSFLTLNGPFRLAHFMWSV